MPPRTTILRSLTVACAAILTASLGVAAQGPALPLPRLVQGAVSVGTRTTTGVPGPNYWQNRAVHDISIEVTPPGRTVKGTETIAYTNSSPYTLPYVVVRLYQNAHRPTAIREENHTDAFLTDGAVIDRFSIDGTDVPWAPLALPLETVKAVVLPTPVAPGQTLQLGFDWHFDLALEAKKEGVIHPTTFFIAYFFPRISVASDVEVSALTPFDIEEFTYRGGREVNNDFADFTVDVTVPKDYLVWATGDLTNPDKVLQPEYAKRLADSMTSDQVTTIATPDELAAGKVTAQTDTVTWSWKADNVTDFALGLSDHYVWDAGSVVGDPATGARVSVQAAYPTSATAWTDQVQNGKDAITYGVTELPGIPWPYPKATLFVGGADEEYPMMANDTASDPEGFTGVVRSIAAHELFHTWFPFYMGINEQRYPILDEGWTTAFEYLFDVGDLGQAGADKLYHAARTSTLKAPESGVQIPAIEPADSLRGPIAANNAYAKASMAYLALRDLLGPDVFKASLQAFMSTWHGKHPLPWDMFASFDAASAQDLDWFWQSWFYQPNYVDLAVEPARTTKRGQAVTVRNNGGFAIPFDATVTLADGTVQTLHQKPDAWQGHPRRTTIRIDSPQQVVSVTIDGGPFEDVNPVDNVWPVAPTPTPAAAPSTAP